MYSGFTSLGSLSHFECCWLLPLYDTFFPWAPWPHFCKLLFFFPLPLRVLLHLCQIVCLWPAVRQGSPGGSVVKNPPTNAGDVGVIPGLGRSLGEGNGNPLQYSCLENPTDRGVWQAIVPGVTEESDTTERLSNNNKRLRIRWHSDHRSFQKSRKDENSEAFCKAQSFQEAGWR